MVNMQEQILPKQIVPKLIRPTGSVSQAVQIPYGMNSIPRQVHFQQQQGFPQGRLLGALASESMPFNYFTNMFSNVNASLPPAPRVWQTPAQLDSFSGLMGQEPPKKPS